VIDDSFQRENVWSKNLKRDYIISIYKVNAITPFVLADIESAIETSREQGDESGCRRLQKQYDSGYRFSILDAQNRRRTIAEFLNNEFTISGILKDADGKERHCNNILFSDLPQRLKDKFLSSLIPITYVYRRGYEEMAEQFLELQKGEPPTNQEKRHAINSPFKFYISSIRQSFHQMFDRIQAVSKKINRKMDEEVLSQATMSLIKSRRERNCGQSDLDKFYNLGKGRLTLETVPEYDPVELGRALTILRAVKSSVLQNKIHSKKVAVRTFWALVAVCEYLYDHNLQVKNGSWTEFYRFVYELDRRLMTESKQKQAIDAKEAEKQELPEPGDSQYYWYLTSVPNNAIARLQRKDALIKRFESELPQEFILNSDEEEYSPLMAQ
jgi:hypothetical protein